MNDEQLIERAGAIAGYQLINEGNGRFTNLTLEQDDWNPLRDQADAEHLALSIGAEPQGLAAQQARRSLVEFAAERCRDTD